MTVRLRVREFREATGLSLRGLAAAAGVSPTTLVRIEAGRTELIALDVLERLADALGVDAALLIDHERR